MRRTGWLLLLLGMVCGGLIGSSIDTWAPGLRADREPVRSPAPDPPGVVKVDRAEWEAAQAELKTLRERTRPERSRDRAAGEAGRGGGEEGPAYARGERRPDGTIEGGARWSPAILEPSIGFLQSYLEQFLKEAEVGRALQPRVRQNFNRVSREVMQLMADFVNGDVDPDQVYDQFSDLFERETQNLGALLTEEQRQVYRAFTRRLGDEFNRKIVTSEVYNLRTRLGLDPAQEKLVAAIVAERYRRVGRDLRHAVPNMFFKAIRRRADREIYTETAGRIRGHLRPDQAAGFDRMERQAEGADAFQAYRRQLVPR